MRRAAGALALALVLAPLAAKAADLVVWWEEGFNPEEDAAVREIIAAFEQETGKQVALAFYPQAEIADHIEAAFEAGQPPDFAFGQNLWFTGCLAENRLVDLSGIIGPFSSMFDPDALAWWSHTNAGQTALIALPIGRSSNHVHVWKSLLEQASSTLEDIPREWNAFWSFWCDQVQPAVRQATGRADSGAWGWPCLSRPATRGGLGDPRRPARDRPAGRQAKTHRGDRRLHGHLTQRLYPARCSLMG